MQRRKDGLCFKCPDKYFPGHKCSPPQFMLIVDNDDHDDPTETQTEAPPEENQNPSFMSLSNAAYFGIHSPQTLRITGYINGKPITILIDCGSTHNIIQPRVASYLDLTSKSIPPFTVMVGNDEHIECLGYCPEVQIQLQKHHFTIPFFVMPVEGADVILGIGRLGSLGRLSADFSIPEISFTKDGTNCTLIGEPVSKHLSSSSLCTLLKNGSVSSLHTLTYLQPHAPVHQTTITHADTTIHNLITQFKSLFEDLKRFPQTEPKTIIFHYSMKPKL
ncbi:putative aspartic peptidase domain superfamily [Helianthus annuus]|nr:putative aspartic peptidase domain superfamily [Helianthus annuus]KAJ0494722.1 putative aspartic peptidase domain superfamily [Helianthus annuus]KAJ0506415.1 putative aspartic peptidase domain superfamily [Helianthus annuus]KAJ0676091.1 putative aspartic peptidase domain superfamily [Helianthus annuus]KAJ0867848.1 putative aspartic peptidase domain superfamily [Helianthus annuus]